MKKVISLLVICIVAILPMTAQVGYESQIKASYNIGVGSYKNRAIPWGIALSRIIFCAGG